MPIRPEYRHLYRGPKWAEIRARVLKRAGNRCEECHKRDWDYVWVWRTPDGQAWQKSEGPVWYACWDRGGATRLPGLGNPHADYPPAHRPRFIQVILTVAHLNHTPGDDRDENLKALCQWCHLNYDKLHHRDTRCTRKDAGRPLLREPA